MNQLTDIVYFLFRYNVICVTWLDIEQSMYINYKKKKKKRIITHRILWSNIYILTTGRNAKSTKRNARNCMSVLHV